MTPVRHIFTQIAYENVGELKGAIDKQADNVFARFPDQQIAIQKLFQRITERGESDKAIRRPEAMSALGAYGKNPPATLFVIRPSLSSRFSGGREPPDFGSGAPVPPRTCSARRYAL